MKIRKYRIDTMSPLVLSSLSFLYPLVLGRQIKCKLIRKGYTTILGSILGSSVLVHSGIQNLLIIDRFFIFIWIVFNTHILVRVRRKMKAIGFAFIVLILGATKMYQKSKFLHMMMHIAGSIGTTILIYEVIDDEKKEKSLPLITFDTGT